MCFSAVFPLGPTLVILCTSESSTSPVSRGAGWHCPVLDSRGHLIQVWHIQDAFSGYLACLEKSIPLNCFGKSYSSIITTPVNSPVTCNMHLLLLLANLREQAHSYCDNEGNSLLPSLFFPWTSRTLWKVVFLSSKIKEIHTSWLLKLIFILNSDILHDSKNILNRVWMFLALFGLSPELLKKIAKLYSDGTYTTLRF